MDTQNTGRQLRYLEEIRISLHRAGFGTLPLEGEQLPVLWNGTPLCRITGKGSVFSTRRSSDLRILSAGGRGHAPGRGCPVSRRGHRCEDAGVYDRYGNRPAAQSQRTG